MLTHASGRLSSASKDRIRAAHRGGRWREGERPLDWSAGEALAFATLATEGCRVRLSGQDAERGTFSHRHAVLHDVENGTYIYAPFQNLAPGSSARARSTTAHLSEIGVLGFEYGYSLDTPMALVAGRRSSATSGTSRR